MPREMTEKVTEETPRSTRESARESPPTPPGADRLQPRARRRRRKRSLSSGRAGRALLPAGGLALVFAALLLYAAAAPPGRIAFAVDAPPAGVTLRGFYGVERNAAGPFRWAKPEATILVPPLAAPGDYRLTLVLQDGAMTGAARAVSVSANGAALATIPIDHTRRAYSVPYRADPAAWGAAGRGPLAIELRTDTFIPPENDRVLGVIVERVAVESVRAQAPWQPQLLLPNLALLVLAYMALRAVGANRRVAASLPGLALVGFLALLVADRPQALLLALQPALFPTLTVAAVLGLAGIVALERVRPRLAPAVTGATAVTTPPPDRRARVRAWLAPGLALAAILVVGAALRFYRLADLMVFLGDQGRDATIVQRMIESGEPVLLGPGASVGGYQRGPAYYYLLLIPFWIAGGNPVAGAALSALLDCLTIALLFLVGWRYFNARVGLAAAGLWAVTPLVLIFSRMLWNPSPLPFFVLALVYALHAFARGDDRSLLVLAPAWAIAWQLHEQALFLLPLLGFAWFWFRPAIRPAVLLGAAGLALLALAPYAIYEAQHDLRNTRGLANFIVGALRKQEQPAADGSRLDRVATVLTQLDLLLRGEHRGLPHWALRLLAVLGFVALGWWARRRPVAATLFGAWSLTTLLYLFWPGTIYFHYLLILFPIPFLAFGLGVDLLCRPHRLAGAAGGVALAALLATSAAGLFGILRDSPPGTYRSTARAVDHILADAAGRPFTFRLVSSIQGFEAFESPYRYLFAWRGQPPSPRAALPPYVVYDPLNIRDGLRYEGAVFHDVRVVRGEQPRRDLNLLIDPDFRAHGGLRAPGWVVPPRPTGWSLPPKGARDEHAADRGVLRLDGAQPASAATAWQQVAVEPGRRYRVRFRYRNDFRQGAQLVQARIAATPWDQASLGAPVGVTLPASAGWAEAEFTFEAPAGAQWATVLLIATGEGRAWFREVELREIAP